MSETKKEPPNKKHIKSFENAQYVINHAWCTSLRAMSAHIGINVLTLKKYYSEEIEKSNADIVSMASESAKDLLLERNYAMTRDVLQSKGILLTDKSETNINVNLNTFVDKPKEPTLEEWLETYSHKPQEIESIEAEVIEE